MLPTAPAVSPVKSLRRVSQADSFFETWSN
jgi:hypothetical protein